jgi:glutaredoxin-related protein
MNRSVNYFENIGVEYHLLKIECSESNFTKHLRYQCNLPKDKNKNTYTF